MAKTTSVVLDDDLDAFVEAQLRSGSYASPAELLREAVRMMKARQEAHAALREALQEGEESGIAETFDFEDFLAGMRTKASQ